MSTLLVLVSPLYSADDGRYVEAQIPTCHTWDAELWLVYRNFNCVIPVLEDMMSLVEDDFVVA